MAAPRTRSLDPQTFLRRAPRQARSAERLETLLVATADLLARDGYPGVTAAALSAATGIPHPSIYDVVGDPRDLVAVWVLRTTNEMHEAARAFGEQVSSRDEAVAFVRFIIAAFFDAYRTDATLRAALSGIDADPAYRWITLEDSKRNARVIADVLVRFTVDPPELVRQRTLLMTHLTGATAAMAVDLGGTAGDEVIAAYEYVVDAVLER